MSSPARETPLEPMVPEPVVVPSVCCVIASPSAKVPVTDLIETTPVPEL